MTIKVHIYPKTRSRSEAELLLAEYAETAGGPIKMPIPIEDIVEKHLKLGSSSTTLHETLRIPMLRDQPDILGAIWFDDGSRS